jgi:hypothetical protein
LKYIPTPQQGDIIFRHVYQGQSGLADKVVDLINPDWVCWCFEPNFCYSVMRVGVRQWRHCKGNRAKMSWIPVPLGTSRMGGGVDKLMIERVPMKYRQFDEEMCAFMLMASALHYCAAELNCGDKDLASWTTERRTQHSPERAKLNTTAKRSVVAMIWSFSFRSFICKSRCSLFS